MNKQQSSKSHFIAPKLLKTMEYETPMGKFYRTATYISRINEVGSIDFTFGNSYEMPLPGFVEALQNNAIVRKIGWYSYKTNLPQTREIVSKALKKHRGISISPDDIFMTNGTVVDLAICLKLLVQ
ncbi:hypothetical protein [Okeania sp. SIO3I5]|uniref:hypothetical protein n=1 Tax=Okeania sp. SIO3I5 TaxID=2607805 RepID=UPI0025FD08B9|nr:hypothetical protein [Okeania sp. SIO3I5]